MGSGSSHCSGRKWEIPDDDGTAPEQNHQPAENTARVEAEPIDTEPIDRTQQQEIDGGDYIVISLSNGRTEEQSLHLTPEVTTTSAVEGAQRAFRTRALLSPDQVSQASSVGSDSGISCDALSIRSRSEEVRSKPSHVTQLQQREPEECDDDREAEEKMVKKLQMRLMASDPRLDANKSKKWAEILVDKEKTKEMFFRHLIAKQKKVTQEAVSGIQSDAEAYGERGFRNAEEQREAKQRVATRLREAGNLQVKVLLYELNQDEWKKSILRKVNRYVKQFQYGPFHVALQIGDMILEWDVLSVVFPRQITHASGPENTIFSGNVHHVEELASTQFSQISVRSDAAATIEGYTDHVNSVVELGERREILLDELARVVVLYNRKYEYGLFSCNCQHFVTDVLQVLGIKDMELFQGKLRVKQHLDLLTMRGTSVPFYEFNSHADLDKYVRDNFDKLSDDDLEFCHCHYLLFHAWQKKRPHIQAWQCPKHACYFTAVDLKLKTA